MGLDISKLASVLKGVAPDAITGILNKVAPALEEKATTQVEQNVTSAAQAPTAPTKTGFQKFVKGAGKLLGAVAPEVAGLIPGVGPLAKMVLSTLNDDEWFEEYSSAGATFNELIATNALKDGEGKLFSPLIPAIAVINTGNGWNSYKENVFPSILAYIREKTNNVLADNTQMYSDAIDASINLYCIYYTLGKYMQLAQDLPLNIPQITDVMPYISPENISVVKGIHEALGHYLKSTTALPYALVEYIRWRFGTAFLSSNTGKPGLILYNPRIIMSAASLPGRASAIKDLQTAIHDNQTVLAQSGRAIADIKLAYGDHQFRMDVEKRHYDEKEFNLRVNFTYGNKKRTVCDEVDDLWTLYMDSRLTASAAIQAVTISTGEYAMFPVATHPIVYTYFQKDVNVPYMNMETPKTYTISSGWMEGSVYMNSNVAPAFALVDRSDAPSASGKGVFLKGTYEYKFSGAGTDITDAITSWISTIAADALQVHNIGVLYNTGTTEEDVTFVVTNLSYDRARISTDQLTAIQRIAARNLWRGDYKTKKQVVNKPEVKEAVADIETTAVKEVL